MKVSRMALFAAACFLTISASNVAAQTCSELKWEYDRAQEQLTSAQVALADFHYDDMKEQIAVWWGASIAACDSTSQFYTECTLDADRAFEENLMWLDDQKSLLELDVSNYDSVVEDYRNRIINQACPF